MFDRANAEMTEAIIMEAIAQGDATQSDLDEFYQTLTGSMLLLTRATDDLWATIRGALPPWLRAFFS